MKPVARKRAVSPYYKAGVITLAITIAFFLVVRLPEVAAVVFDSPLHTLMIAAIVVATGSLFLRPPETLGRLTRRLGLIFLVVYQFRNDLDITLIKQPNLSDMTGSICIVTGANSGTGYAISEKLGTLGATVIMTCRDEERCQEAVRKIQASNKNITGTLNPMTLDLADIGSVKKFIGDFKSKYQRLDVLVNNAGVAAQAGDRTVQGFETSLGVMHIGHAVLTKGLLDLMLKPLPSNIPGTVPEEGRIVFVGSVAYLAGAFDVSLFQGTGTGDLSGEITDNCAQTGPGNLVPCCPLMGCPFTNGYARAKLANLMYAFELQRRLDQQANANGRSKPQRRIVTSSLHPGSVNTNIHPFLGASIMSLFLRSKHQAANVLMYAIQSHDYLPGAYIDSMAHSHDLFDIRDKYLPVHLAAFPSSRELHFASPPAITHFSIDEWIWKRKNSLVHDPSGVLSNNEAMKTPQSVAMRLWDVTEQIISNWDSKKGTWKSM